MKSKIILTFFALLVIVSYVSAAGIASPYFKDNPLRMNYGETKIIDFNLQNVVGDEDITVEAMITKGSDIATLDQTIFTARAGTSDTMIPVTITIPQDYTKNSEAVELEVKAVTTDQGGMVTLGTGWVTSFDVLLTQREEPKSTSGMLIWMILGVVVLVVVILFMIRKRRTGNV